MATTIRDLLVVLGVDSKGAEEAVERLDKALESVTAEMGDTVAAADDVDDAMGGMADGTDKAADAADDLKAPVGELKGALGELTAVALGFVAAGVLLAGVLLGVAVMAADAADAIGKGATRTALSVEAYQELKFAFEQAGLTATELEQAMAKQSEAMAQLAANAGPAADGYKALGLEAADFAGLNAEEKLRLTAEALAGVTDEQERLRIAQQIYGAELGGKLLPVLEGGAENLDEMAKVARDLGIVMSGEQVEAAELFNDTLAQMFELLAGIRNQIGLALLPTLTDWLAGMRDWFIANRDIINSRLDQFIEFLVFGLESLAKAVEFVNEVVAAVFGGWGPILVGVALAIGAVVAAVVAFATLQAWIALSAAITALGAIGLATFGQIAAAIGLVVAAVVVLFLLFEDFFRFMQGTDSALGRFIEQFREADGVIGAVARIIEQGLMNLQAFIGVVQQVGAVFLDIFARTVLPLLELVATVNLRVLIGLLQVLGAVAGFMLDTFVLPMFRAFGSLIDFIAAGLMSLQPAIDFLLAGLDAILAAVSAITGIDITVGNVASGGRPSAGPGFGFGGGDPFGPSTGQLETGGALFAPTPMESVPASAFTMPAQAGGPTTTIEGSTWNISGLGLSREEVLEVIAEIEARQNRNVAAAHQGQEV